MADFYYEATPIQVDIGAGVMTKTSSLVAKMPPGSSQILAWSKDLTKLFVKVTVPDASVPAFNAAIVGDVKIVEALDAATAESKTASKVTFDHTFTVGK